MERGIDPDAPLDYVELQIFPRQNRYEAWVWSSNRSEKVASEPLEQLLLHSPQVKDLSFKGSNTSFKILPPENVNQADWFTTATLTRFLGIVGSPNFLRIGNEIALLEETRNFQLSLFAKAEDISSSVESKNELQQAVGLRLSALKVEFVAAFNQATGAICSLQDISYLENFAHHFGAKDLRDSLQKFVELSQYLPVKDPSKSSPIPQTLPLDPPLQFDVSPAKVAQVERQSSTDDESCDSSEDDQPSVERSRTLTRSTTPRRSASPMRRIQIGRSGPRRVATLSIKSLNHVPAREKAVSQRDAVGSSSEEEDSGKPVKNTVLRMSVQDKISLFESKQKDQGVDIQKTKPLLTASVKAKKAVPRRWSSGTGESATQCLHDTNETSSPMSPKNIAPDGDAETNNIISKTQISVETAENIKSRSPENGASDQVVVVADTLEPERDESCEYPASNQWSQQKEAELDQLFMKLTESKPARHRNVTSDNRKSKNFPKEQRGGFYDHYKQKRDEKLRGEAAGKRAEQEAQFKVMHQFLDDKKAEMSSTNTSDVNKRLATVNKSQKTQKNLATLTSSKKEASKTAVIKKATSKPSPLPATRKSWTSAPSPARTPSGPTSTGTTPTSRKPQSASSVVRTSTKVERSQPRSKTLKATQPDANKSIRTDNENKQPMMTKSTKTTKTKVRTPEVDTTTTTSKPSFYNKVTKKSSVVPLETKPFLRKGSKMNPNVAPVVKTKVVTQTEELLRSSGDLIQAEENAMVKTTDITSQDPEECKPLEFEPHVVSPTKCEESESSNQLNVSGFHGLDRIEMSTINSRVEEVKTISPSAWVEIEEHDHGEITPCLESPIKITSSANLVAPAGCSSPRVRNSLFKMLLEETSEADTGEWGNAEHPPAMVYQKDEPKGLKRLLKFARKTKADAYVTDWSSPRALSGENDAEESKGQSNGHRFTVENRRKIGNVHVSASMSTRKATRSFFSLSALRGSKDQ